MVALGTHLDALSLVSNPLKHDNFDAGELVGKNRRRAARVCLFVSLMRNKFNDGPLNVGEETLIAYPQVLKTARTRFMESDFCKLLLAKDNDAEIKKFGEEIDGVVSAFGRGNYL